MNTPIRKVANRAYKKLHHNNSAHAKRIIRNTRVLTEQGLRTPLVNLDTATHELVMPWINGTCARAKLRTVCARCQTSSWMKAPVTELAALIRPLVTLHQTDSDKLDLAIFDPWRRINPRINETSKVNDGLEQKTFDRLLEMEIKLQRTEQIEPRVVHGDFHIGQLLIDGVSGESWLLDLDDLALGYREADIGNFAAHCATSADLKIDNVLDDFFTISGLTRRVYSSISGDRLSMTWVHFYGAVALLRRALKLAEHGRHEPPTQEILDACVTLTHYLRVNTKVKL